MNISGSTIIVTGASSGIGEACAKLLAEKGAYIILIARNTEKLSRVKNYIIENKGKAIYYSIDLTNIQEVKTSSELIIEKHGIPDILINSAGAGRWLSLNESSMEEYSEMIASPLLASANISKAFLTGMKMKNSGHIITINSVSCFFSYPGANGYLSARWGLRGFMNALYEDLYYTNINVSMIAAGKVDSPYFSTNEGSADRIPKIATFLSKTSTSEEIAEVILKTISKPKKTIITPTSMAVLVSLNRFFPRIFSFLMRKTSFKED